MTTDYARPLLDAPELLTPPASGTDQTPTFDLLGPSEPLPSLRPTVGCVIPAYNESDSIAHVLESLLAQTRVPDVIHVVVNNTTDDTVERAGVFAGEHPRPGVPGQRCTVYVHDIGANPDKKVGALNYGYALVEHCDYLLGVDGDTVAAPDAVEHLLEEIHSDSRIGGISAIYAANDEHTHGPIAGFLIAGQRAQFAAFNMQNLLRGRNMAVLGGQYSIFSMSALREVMRTSRQATPWVRDSEVEDSLLSLQIKNAGYLTKISARARAQVGAMTTLRGLDAQQVKWNHGAIELMWPGQRGNTKGQPFHPNLRLRWFEHGSMVLNLLTRILFAFLLAGSLSIDAYVFSAWWLVPPVVAILLNLRVAHSMHDRSTRDYLFALLVVPAEMYMWLRLGHFVRAWVKFFSRSSSDNWAAQARAEQGRGYSYLGPLAALVILVASVVAIWTQLSIETRSDVLSVMWPILGVITVLQTAFMARRVVRRYRGYRA